MTAVAEWKIETADILVDIPEIEISQGSSQVMGLQRSELLSDTVAKVVGVLHYRDYKDPYIL